MTAAEKLNFSVPSKVAMSAAEYHAHPALGSTSIKNVLRSPMHYLYAKENPVEKAAFNFGRAVHTAILEPDKFKEEIVVMPEFWGVTKQGKPTNSANADDVKAKREAWLLANTGKTVISTDEKADLLEMAKAISRHKTARSLLTGGAAEESYFDQDPETGLIRKARPDFLREGHIIVDVKTTHNADPVAIPKQINDYKYHLSAAYYLDVVSNVLGQNFNQFIIIAAERTAPYGVSVHLIDEGAIEVGRAMYRKALKMMKECKEKGAFPGYPDQILSTSIPSYAFPSEYYE